MDIFSASKRQKIDSFKTPLNYPDATATQQKLKEQNQGEIKQFQHYLKNLYAKFDFKINKCNHNCISTATTYREIADCQHNCNSGVNKFSNYVDSRVTEMQELLRQCADNANTLPNAMNEIYYCYQSYNKSFTKLKQFITEESLYYE